MFASKAIAAINCITQKEGCRAPRGNPLFGFISQVTAIIDQTNHKGIFESVALQRFQKFPWFGFEREAL
ncbi:hypothetical protein PseudUWO310_22300 [Pseudanabaena sp. UWO310]|nr:hypothetical protein PseudUWO310_22300 [Pseudanabaena sp. UWO310]